MPKKQAQKKNTNSAKSRRTSGKTRTEEFKVSGEELLAKVKALIKEGNVRRITVSNKEGKEIIVLPLTVGVVGVLLLAPLAAVGAVAALVTECTITVEREE